MAQQGGLQSCFITTPSHTTWTEQAGQRGSAYWSSLSGAHKGSPVLASAAPDVASPSAVHNALPRLPTQIITRPPTYHSPTIPPTSVLPRCGCASPPFCALLLLKSPAWRGSGCRCLRGQDGVGMHACYMGVARPVRSRLRTCHLFQITSAHRGI